MAHENNDTHRAALRIFVCGSGEGSASLVEVLAKEPELELVGVAATPQEASGALSGGHLNVVLFATDSQTLPGSAFPVLRLAKPGAS